MRFSLPSFGPHRQCMHSRAHAQTGCHNWLQLRRALEQRLDHTLPKTSKPRAPAVQQEQQQPGEQQPAQPRCGAIHPTCGSMRAGTWKGCYSQSSRCATCCSGVRLFKRAAKGAAFSAAAVNRRLKHAPAAPAAAAVQPKWRADADSDPEVGTPSNGPRLCCC